MFSQASVILFTGGCLPDTPWADTPGQTYPWVDTTWADTPWTDSWADPPWVDTAQVDNPWADTLPPDTATAADGTHPTGMHSC